MNKIELGLAPMALAVLLGSCDRQKQPEENKAAPTSRRKTAAMNNMVDQGHWQWSGPEWTFIAISKHGDRYLVKINSFDGQERYDGIAVGDYLEFQRDGKGESLCSGSGADTGMKWIRDEQNCLVIKTGEGFCTSPGTE